MSEAEQFILPDEINDDEQGSLEQPKHEKVIVQSASLPVIVSSIMETIRTYCELIKHFSNNITRQFRDKLNGKVSSQC